MNVLVSIDGRIVPAAEATISVFDRGFLYGDSVFEAFRTYGRVPFALDAHLERLARSAARTLIELPVSLAVLRSETEALLAAAGHRESVVRMMVSRGSAQTFGLDPSLARGPRRVTFAIELVELPDELYERGATAITYQTQRIADATNAAGAKLGNYLVSVLAMREAKAKGAEEALVMNGAGEVGEGCTSNVFLLESGVLVTPPESMGILLGITREHVLDLAKQAGIPVEERPFLAADLARAGEAFITSSIREIVPIIGVDGAVIGTGKPGPVTRQLIAAFRQRTRDR